MRLRGSGDADLGPVSGLHRPMERIVTDSGALDAVEPSRALPRLHVIVVDDLVGSRDFRSRIRPVLDAGGNSMALHLRTRTTPIRRLFEMVSWLVGLSRETGTVVMVNDRVDVALAAGAGGVHLREDSLPAALVREMAGAGLRLGRSIHSPDQARHLRRPVLDYLVLGAVYPTRSHPGRPAIGAEALTRAVECGDLPVVAIGGITPAEVPALLSRGAHGVMVLSGVWRAPDPQRAVKRYLQALQEEEGR